MHCCVLYCSHTHCVSVLCDCVLMIFLWLFLGLVCWFWERHLTFTWPFEKTVVDNRNEVHSDELVVNVFLNADLRSQRHVIFTASPQFKSRKFSLTWARQLWEEYYTIPLLFCMLWHRLFLRFVKEIWSLIFTSSHFSDRQKKTCFLLKEAHDLMTHAVNHERRIHKNYSKK